jgi:hypothetical protein
MFGALRINPMARIRIKIRYRNRVLLKILLLSLMVSAVFIAAFGLRRKQTIASSPQYLSSAILGVRQYYLTKSLFTGNQVANACTPGYHFASIWEIADPSGLKYNTSLGLTSPDSGSGPPVAINLFGIYHVVGWVHTGYNVSSSEPPGHANCNGWLSNYQFYWGTVAGLPSDWTGGEQDIGVWNVGVVTCDFHLSVWCVQDDSLNQTYLPLMLK